MKKKQSINPRWTLFVSIIFAVLSLVGCATTQEISMNEEQLFKFTLSDMDIHDVTLKDGNKYFFDVEDGKLVQEQSGDSLKYFIVGDRKGKNSHPEVVKIPLNQVLKVNGERVEGAAGSSAIILGIGIIASSLILIMIIALSSM